MTEQTREMYSYILAGIAIIVALYFAMKLRRSIRKDQARQAFRSRIRPGPALARPGRHKIRTRSRH